MRISDCSSDVCSSDLGKQVYQDHQLSRPKVFYARVFNAEQIDGLEHYKAPEPAQSPASQTADIFYGLNNTVLGSASGRERVCQYLYITVAAVLIITKHTLQHNSHTHINQDMQTLNICLHYKKLYK